MALQCIIADDEPLAKMLLEKYVRRTPDLELAGSFGSAQEAREAILRGDGQVAFLDIQMPGIDGLQLARVAEKVGMRVVFTTAYREYAIEGFRLNALDYLLKPISYEEFLEAANRAVAAISAAAPHEAEADSMVIRSNYRNVPVAFDSIVYIEGLRDYVKFHLAAEEKAILTQMSLKAVVAELPSASFVRIHRSYIVAVNAVRAYSRSTASVELSPGGPLIELPIGDTFRQSFIQIMSSRL